MITTLREYDQLPTDGFLLMRWVHEKIGVNYVVVNLKEVIDCSKSYWDILNFFETREEAILELEIFGRKIYEIPFEASLFEMRHYSFIRKCEL